MEGDKKSLSLSPSPDMIIAARLLQLITGHPRVCIRLRQEILRIGPLSRRQARNVAVPEPHPSLSAASRRGKHLLLHTSKYTDWFFLTCFETACVPFTSPLPPRYFYLVWSPTGCSLTPVFTLVSGRLLIQPSQQMTGRGELIQGL